MENKNKNTTLTEQNLISKSLSLHGRGTSIKRGGVKLVLWHTLGEIMRLSKYFSLGSNDYLSSSKDWISHKKSME
jgi:hypothetical protein